MEILAHRTGMAHAPENSLEGFAHCHESGAAAVECDITFIDGAPYVWARGTDESTPVLRLGDVLEFIETHPGMRVYFDVKFYDSHFAGHFCSVPEEVVELAVRTVIAPAMERGLESSIGFVTFRGGAELLRTAKKMSPAIATDLMVIFPWTRPQTYRAYVDAVTIGWDAAIGNHWEFFPGSLTYIIAQARVLGMQVRGGLANRAEDVDWLIGLGAEALWTDDVPYVGRYLSERSSQSA